MVKVIVDRNCFSWQIAGFALVAVPGWLVVHIELKFEGNLDRHCWTITINNQLTEEVSTEVAAGIPSVGNHRYLGSSRPSAFLIWTIWAHTAHK